MENSQYIYATIVLLALCTAICRAGYFMLGISSPCRTVWRSALRYAPLAALTAIVIPELLPLASA